MTDNRSTAELPSSTLSPTGGSGTPQLSVVVPVFNERENLKPLHEKLKLALDGLGRQYEVLFVDDGSLDGSTALLKEIADSDPKVRILQFVRNFGQTAAMSAGFDHARGEIIIPLDADLQNDPEDIPRIIAALEEGSDVVSCWRKDRQDPWLTRVAPSNVANWLISRISGVKLHDYGCTLKGYRRDVIRHVRLYGEMHRFIPIFAAWAGARVTELPVKHHARQFGRSKYGIFRTIKVLLDLITIKFLGSFSTKPMYLFGGAGFVCFGLGALLAAVTLYQRFYYAVRAHRNPLLLMSVFAFVVGVQFILSGLIAELIIRTYHESQGKRTYILKETTPGPGAGQTQRNMTKGV